MTLIEHLRELRSRLVKSVAAVIPGAVIGWIFYQPIIKFVTEPACEAHVVGVGSGDCSVLTTTGLTGPINLALSVAIVTGLLIAAPVWLYQLWAFVTPGLHKHEQRWSLAFLATSVPLFFSGAAICYLLLPKVVKVLLSFAPADATPGVSVNEYLSVVVHLMLAFGLAFELPVFIALLNAAGVLKAAQLRKAWRAAVLGIFVFAAVATPTGDPYTMFALALPMTVLYILSYFFCAWNDRRRKQRNGSFEDLDDDAVSPLDERPSLLDGQDYT